MVKKLKRFPHKTPGRPPTYDWPKLLNGSIWRLTKGKDFFSECDSFRGAVYSAAARSGLKVRVSVDGDIITLQKTGKA